MRARRRAHDGARPYGSSRRCAPLGGPGRSRRTADRAGAPPGQGMVSEPEAGAPVSSICVVVGSPQWSAQAPGGPIRSRVPERTGPASMRCACHVPPLRRESARVRRHAPSGPRTSGARRPSGHADRGSTAPPSNGALRQPGARPRLRAGVSGTAPPTGQSRWGSRGAPPVRGSRTTDVGHAARQSGRQLRGGRGPFRTSAGSAAAGPYGRAGPRAPLRPRGAPAHAPRAPACPASPRPGTPTPSP